MFGWSALQRVLEAEGVFANLCPGVPVANCNAATIKFNAIFTAGAFGASGGALVFGMVFDRFGPLASSILGHSMLILGAFMFAFSNSSGTCGPCA